VWGAPKEHGAGEEIGKRMEEEKEEKEKRRENLKPSA
jgi:hypothetical protein